MGDVSDNVNREPGRGEIQPHVLRTHDISIGKELIFGEAEVGVPVVFGRDPATPDPKYASTKAHNEIHVKLFDEEGKGIKHLSRRSLAITFTPKGCQIANLTDKGFYYEIDPGSKKVLSPKMPAIILVSGMRNFKAEIAPGFLLKTQAIGGGTGRSARVETLLFKRGSI